MRHLSIKVSVLLLVLVATLVPFAPRASAHHLRTLVVQLTVVPTHEECPATFLEAYETWPARTFNRNQAVALCVNVMNGSEEGPVILSSLTIVGDGAVIASVSPNVLTGTGQLGGSGTQVSHRIDMPTPTQELEVRATVSGWLDGEIVSSQDSFTIEIRSLLPAFPGAVRNPGLFGSFSTQTPTLPTPALPWWYPIV